MAHLFRLPFMQVSGKHLAVQKVKILLKSRKLLKSVAILFASILILYPILHELGHALATWLFGGEVVRITIYPAVYTECYIPPNRVGCYLITALAGILFPLIISAILLARRRDSLPVVLGMRVMSVGYALEELFTAVKIVRGSNTESSDLSRLTYVVSWDPRISLMLAVLLLMLSVGLLVSMEPIKNMVRYIEDILALGEEKSTPDADPEPSDEPFSDDDYGY